ncbi:MAG: Uma2 family endonuclease [Synechococcales cyanobacterium RM1_1_8]|nr:Uma2 family endonuclease [Synechococcales cyanobacterium RM1_1_8]
MVTAVRQQPPQATEREHVLLQNIAWETFEALVDDLESQPSKRLTYDNGMLEIWMPKPPHESYKRWLGRIVEILTEELEIEIRSLSSCTWRRPDLTKGVEADECYYIQNEAVIRNRMDIDLAFDPPPDLAIEIDITSLSLPRLPIYQALGVSEVWRFDGELLAFLQLVDDEYVEIEQSVAIPLLSAANVTALLAQAQEMGETSWARSVRRWVQEQK